MAPTRFASACSRSRWARFTPHGLIGFTSHGLIGLALVLALSLGCVHAKHGREGPSSLLEIASETSDADVWVDGQYIGQVSAVSGRLKLAPGVHRVEIRKPGHFPVQRTVRVEKQGGGSVVVEAELLADPR